MNSPVPHREFLFGVHRACAVLPRSTQAASTFPLPAPSLSSRGPESRAGLVPVDLPPLRRIALTGWLLGFTGVLLFEMIPLLKLLW